MYIYVVISYEVKLSNGWWFSERNMTGLFFPCKFGNGIIIPSDELILFRGVETTNQ